MSASMWCVWTPLPQSTGLVVEVITLIAAAIGSLAAVAVCCSLPVTIGEIIGGLLVALTESELVTFPYCSFTYPAVLLIYQTLFITVKAVAIIAPF